MKLFYINFIIFLFLSGCASTTPTAYQEHSIMGGGYTDYDLSKDKKLQKNYPEYDFFLTVKLNANSKLERAKDFAQRRAAELTIANGYSDYTFQVAYSNYITSKWEGGGVGGYHRKPQVNLAIKFYNSPQDDSKNANDVIDKISSKYDEVAQKK